MDQNDTPPSDANPPDPKKTVRLPPEDLVEFARARILLFILLPILILLFNTNQIVVSIIPIVLILLSIPMFNPISNYILKATDILLFLLFAPFQYLWRFLFVKTATKRKSWLRYRRLIIDVIALIAIFALLGTTTLRPTLESGFGNLNDSVCLKTQLPWPTCASGFGVSTLPNGARIGLIGDSTYGPFDQSILNQHEIDIENLIFRENLQACTGRHITLVDATMLSRTVENQTSTATSSLYDLEGSYLAQHTSNVTNPAIKICLAIANLGTSDTADENSSLVKRCPDCYSPPQVIHQIAQLAHSDPSFRGIVGFRFSQQAREALDLIKGYQDLSTIPIVSPSASSDELSNQSNFYRIVSPDHSQGTALAQFFCDSLMQSQPSNSIAMLRDNSNIYSRSLQSAFSDAISCLDPAHKQTILYSNGDSESIKRAVDLALQQNVTYIFFPGYDQDLDTLELEIHQVKQDDASDITILGGDGISNVDATTHYSYNRVYATDFAGPLLKTDPLAKSFIQQEEFPKPPFVNTIPSSLWLPATILSAFDSVKAFAETVKSGYVAQDDFNKALASISFSGASGEITFQGTRNNGHSSDREQGYIYLTCNDYAHNLHLMAKYSTTNANDRPVQRQPLDQASSCP